MILFLLACTGTVSVTEDSGGKDSLPILNHDTDTGTSPVDTGDSDTDSGDTGDTHDTYDTNDSVDTNEEPHDVDCSAQPALPTEFVHIDNIQTSEDFAFDADGYLVHADDRGDVEKVDIYGNQTLILPHFGTSAGTRFLLDGDLVIANVGKGSVDRVGMDGSHTQIATGLLYPNGLDVGLDGYIYVADQSRAELLRIDPETGESQTLASGLNNPNGVTFSPDHETVYVGSFGGGIIYAVEHDAVNDTWASSVYAGLPGAVDAANDDCVDLAVGDECYQRNGKGPGVCVDDDGNGVGTCTGTVDTSACTDLSTGDTCTTTRLGTTYENTCVEDPGGGADYCPAYDTDRTDDGCTKINDACTYDGGAGKCQQSYEGELICVTPEETKDEYTADCADKAEGDACEILNPAAPDKGTCQMLGKSLRCTAWWTPATTGGGGFDAINMDECGNLFIGEYTTGNLYRWTGPGDEPETVFELPASWIPNMHFGSGVGGWHKDTLYVMDRSRGGVFAVDLDMWGHGDDYP